MSRKKIPSPRQTPQSRQYAHYIWFTKPHYHHLVRRCKAEGFRNVPELVRALVREDLERSRAALKEAA